MTRTLYLFGSAAPPVFDAARVIEDAQARGWDVCLGLTPTAADWLAEGADGLAALTGRPVRSRYKRPRDPDVWPGAEGPHPPGRGGAETYPWSLALDAVDDLVRDVPQACLPAADGRAVEFRFGGPREPGAGFDSEQGRGVRFHAVDLAEHLG